MSKTLIDPDNMMTATQCARLFGVSRQTIYDWLEAGTAPASTVIAGTRYFHRDDAMRRKRYASQVDADQASRPEPAQAEEATHGS